MEVWDGPGVIWCWPLRLRFVVTFTWWAEANNTERPSNLSKLVTLSTTAFTGLLSRKGRKSITVSYTNDFYKGSSAGESMATMSSNNTWILVMTPVHVLFKKRGCPSGT